MPGPTEMSGPTERTASSQLLLVTGSEDALEAVLPLCAVAGVEPRVTDPSAVRRGWLACRLVVIAADATEACLAAGLARRDGVVLLGEADAPDVWRQAVALGADHVVFLPQEEAEFVDILTARIDAGSASDVPPGAVVAVTGGRGGAGATTTAVGLGLAAARSRADALLIDADPYGGGIDLALGVEDAPGLRWPDLITRQGHLSGATLSSGLPRIDSLAVLSWDRVDPAVPGGGFADGSEALATALYAARRSCDLVIVDVPRVPGPMAEAVAEQASVVLLVVPAEVRACAAAGRISAWWRACGADLRLLVRGPAPGGLSASTIADALGLPLAGWVRAEPGLPAAYDRGDRPASAARSPLGRFSRDFVDELMQARYAQPPAA